MAFPEEGLSFLRLPCAMRSSASCICSRELSTKTNLISKISFWKEAGKSEVKVGQVKVLSGVARPTALNAVLQQKLGDLHVSVRW